MNLVIGGRHQPEVRLMHRFEARGSQSSATLGERFASMRSFMQDARQAPRAR